MLFVSKKESSVCVYVMLFWKCCIKIVIELVVVI